ncbi:65-kDa microtubule-associated protein 5 [Dorcoceras hygrometricum]|uniref:65-kDa microtubule-associated protein 5 n=1 Tax=Dorcoceras hygrometricum TaxID=472368 RepID=A0A2Z7D5K9_9LAMI|nr:65-kDa microtubule-associated protein 5 [Dorcoceras hygrometricum]
MSARSIGGSSPLSLSKSAATTCSSLLRELQEIWDEIGECDTDRDKMLLQLEQECLDIYRRKVERSRNCKAELLQSLAASEAEIAGLSSALGEQISYPRFDNMKENLRQQISIINPTLDILRLKKQERIKEIAEAEFHIAQICAEISGDDQVNRDKIQVDELDLTINKLRGLESHLQELQSERNLRVQKVNSHISSIHDLSVVMSLDFKKIMTEIHPSLVDPAIGQSKSISNETLARLTNELNLLKKEKQQRLLKLQKLGSTLFELWNLMDTTVEEQQKFKHVTCLTASDIDGVFTQGCLSFDVIEQTEVEVARLNDLKASKMRELIFKRQSELEEIYNVVHMDVDSEKARQILTTLLESGSIDLSDLLSSMDDQVAKAKEQAQSRKEILDKVEKWKHAADEESWLDEYERDENRYSAGRGVHKNLKRAEKARILVSKIPSLVESLTAKVRAWELEKGMPFIYNKTPLLRTLEEFNISRQEKEEEKRRSREQRKLQEQLATEQEALFGSKSAVKKPLAQSTYSNTMVATPNGGRLRTPSTGLGISRGKDRRVSGKAGSVIPINYVALPKDDRCS